MPRMANVTITRSDIFPNGTLIKVYPRNALHLSQQGAPSGKSVAEGTMTSGTVTIEGLSAGQEYTAYAEVGGQDALLAIQAPASAAIVASTGQPEPENQGLLGWSFDPVVASSNVQLATDGTLVCVRVPLKEQVTIKNILLDLTTAGVTLTAAQNLCGIFAEGTRKLLGEVLPATLITALEGAAGLITLPLVAPVVAGPGFVTVGLVKRGTTGPKLASAPLATAGVINAGVTGKASRFATGNTGLTNALPNPIEEAMVAAANPIWVGLS